MTATTMHPTARAKQWDERFFLEYVRGNKFARYMGTTANSVIQVNERLTGRRGDTIYCTLVGALRGAPNDGSTALVGNEKALLNYGWGSVVAPVRDAVTIDNMEAQASGIDIRNAGRQALRNLATDYLRLHICEALDDRTAATNVATAGSGSMTEDQWAAANADRVAYGDASYATSFAASIGTVTGTMSAGRLDRMKSLARTAGGNVSDTGGRAAVNRLTPIRVQEEEEWFVVFMGSVDRANLVADTTIAAANREAWQRYGGDPRTGGSGSNPLFRGGDIVYNGMICREIPELDDLADPAGDATVTQSFLCGAQALHCAWAKRTQTTIKKEDDYGYAPGVGFEEIRAVSKVFWEDSGATDLRQWGVVSGYSKAS